MKETHEEYLSCPIRQVVSKFCDKWSLLALYTIHEHGVMRFTELHRHMSDCSQKMLSATLKKLESHHLVARKLYPVVPPKVEYSLTETGQSLMPPVLGLIKWGSEHFDQIRE
ncbi:MAG: helix-turn-helix transcriptional regulator [Muribaculaceae bacterium]|nr:helix-turn-helix transcriptional regulator [Muribaculaceae bacterium]